MTESPHLDVGMGHADLLNLIDQGFCVLDVVFDEAGTEPLDYRFLQVNPAFEEMTGIPISDALSGKTVRQLIPDLENKWIETYGQIALTGEPQRFVDRSDVMNRWFSVYGFRVGGDESRKVGLLFTDISDQKVAEEHQSRLSAQLESERSRLQYLFTNAPAFVATLQGPDHTFELANPAYLQLIGQRDVIGKPVRDALPEVEGQGMFELLDNVFATGKAFVGREIGVKLQNQARESLIERIVNFVYQPIFESDGSVSGIFVHGVDVTDQVQARKDAEKANRAKDEFLATLSHELRTPLNSILGWVTMLRNQQLDDDTKEKAIEIIQRNARLQSQLIEDVLDVSRIISGKLRLEVEPIDLASIVTSAIETVTPAANAKEIRVEAVLDPNIGQVTGDPNRLRQAVWNLLTNAVKFTPASGRVDVRLNRAGSNIELIVVDTGVGISPEVLPHVFERFRQANSAISRMHGGLGLGLAIVRHLVEMHGGTVRAESAGENSGAAFTITLPLVRADREEPADEIQSGLPAADTTE